MKPLILGILLSFLALPPPCASASGQKPLPRWTTDLRAAGYFIDDFSPPGAHQANRQIAFGSNVELVVANDASTSFERPGPVSGFVLDIPSGRILSKPTWRAKGFPYIFATNIGDYAVNTETGLTLYSPGLRMVKAEFPYSIKLASPDGASFAAWKRVPGPHGLTFFLDPQTLRPTGVEYLDQSVDSIVRDRIAYAPIIGGSHAVCVLDPSVVVSTYKTDCKEPRPRFLSMDVLAVAGCDRVDVIDTTQGLRFSHRTEAYDTNLGGVSRSGNRFVIAEAFYGVGHDPKLRFERFAVIDVAVRHPVLTVEIKELRGRRSGASGAALSPDGSLLAINSLGVVRVFDIPAEAASSK